MYVTGPTVVIDDGTVMLQDLAGDATGKGIRNLSIRPEVLL
jgi:hypothetical protein